MRRARIGRCGEARRVGDRDRQARRPGIDRFGVAGGRRPGSAAATAACISSGASVVAASSVASTMRGGASAAGAATSASAGGAVATAGSAGGTGVPGHSHQARSPIATTTPRPALRAASNALRPCPARGAFRR
ncbi:MAG: hypothetical protein JKP98_07925 [Rhodobacteraceae bacterium]|nr:hypothetical protein [Paracoccaceae bacterium]